MADLRVGDIAVWFDGRRLLSHRVVANNVASIATRPDWSDEHDPPIASEQLLGKAVRFGAGPFEYPLEGRVAEAAQALVLAARPLVSRALRLAGGVRSWMRGGDATDRRE